MNINREKMEFCEIKKPDLRITKKAEGGRGLPIDCPSPQKKRFTWELILNFDKENLGIKFDKIDFDLLGWGEYYGPEKDGGFVDFDNYESVGINMDFERNGDGLPMTYYGSTGTQVGTSFKWPGDWKKDANTIMQYLLAGDCSENEEFSFLAEQWLEILKYSGPVKKRKYKRTMKLSIISTNQG